MSKIERFIYNSNFKTPYIIYKREFSVPCRAGDIARTSFEHGLPFTPLLIGQWSLNSDFLPSYDLSLSTPNFSQLRPERVCNIGADESRVYFDLADNLYDGDVVFYFRIMAFAPPEFEGDISEIYQDSGNFISDSRLNYPKVWKFEKVGASAEIEHNFGYIPQVKVWSKTSIPIDTNYKTRNVIAPIFTSIAADLTSGALANEHRVRLNSATGDEQYVMILGDEL